MPLLEAQPAKYLYLQTKAFKDKRRPDYAMMQTNTANPSDRDIRDIADYFAAQSPIPSASQIDAAKTAAGKAKADDLKCHLPSFHSGDDIPRLAGPAPG